MTDDKKMSMQTDRVLADRQLADAIARDRRDDPAPQLSEAALARIMAEIPEASPTALPVRSGTWHGFDLSAIAGLFRPVAWQAFAVAGIAGVVAGAILPSATMVADSDVTPEQEFAIYLQSDDAIATLLEEDL